jgi:hypothetical protein
MDATYSVIICSFKGAKDGLEPTANDGVSIYIVAAAAHYHRPPHAIEQPSLSRIKQTALGVYRVLAPMQRDDNGQLLEDLAICMYDKDLELWHMRLQDGAIVKVARAEAGQFVVVTD